MMNFNGNKNNKIFNASLTPFKVTTAMNITYPLGHLNISGLETGHCRYVPLWLSCQQYSPWGLLMHFAAAAAAATSIILQ